MRASGWHTLVCQDAYKLMPWADVLYGCDAKWWNTHDGTDFAGQKWASHNNTSSADDKLDVAERYDLRLIAGKAEAGFSTNPACIHYNDNSGFQALNLAILLGSPYIVLVGFDMQHVKGRSHFFGDHPSNLFQRNEYQSFARKFTEAPAGVTIVNATPNSALTTYPTLSLDAALSYDCLPRNGAEHHTAAS